MEKAIERQEKGESMLMGKSSVLKRRFFDGLYILGFLFALLPGPFPSLSGVASILLLACIVVSFFDENFYLYMALFIYLRYRLLIGDTPAFRVYTYLMVLRFLIDLRNIKFKVAYLPALFVFFMHSIFATSRVESLRVGFNIIVDCALIYILMMRVLPDARLMRKFIFAFMLGGIASGIYGWTNMEFTKDINVSGAGVHTVSRNFGALSDANFAGLFYSLCFICSLTLKKIPIWLRCMFAILFSVMLLQTASLSGFLILTMLSVFLIILRYRTKSIVILPLLFIGIILIFSILWSVPQFREMEAIQGLMFRISEKLSYIPRGRWDLLTTDRYAIWQETLRIFSSKSLWGQLIGGSVVTVMVIDKTIFSIACHNSYLQSILNFGIIGTFLIYLPLFAIFIYRIIEHFSNRAGYENEDIKILQLILPFAFIIFGLTVDFFIDWPYMLLYFI
jgi:O-antigen ligase